MESLSLSQESALDLPLKGSVGSFNVGGGQEGQTSIDVKYFLTHVGLDFSSGTNEKVLSHIAPVREIFKFEDLEFDEIMQRDLDDARVSSELVPYLLDAQSRDLVKLFPPIIVVVLPVQQYENRPADLYPPVETGEEQLRGHTCKVTRAGAVGKEAFQFEQPLLDGQPVEHDLVRLRLNTHRTRLVIVDGQHRAMALLALYRNLKDKWSDEARAPYKEYYAEWTPSYIREFDLDEINLPVMLCTFPQLSAGYAGDFDLKKAARLVFLTLNKNARKVSDSRNRLLDDSDLIAHFLRRCLSAVKKKDLRSPHALRIHNVELDQVQDRTKLHDPVALTGVNHLYYIVEHLMLSDDDTNGVKPRSGRLTARKDLTSYGLMRRLGGRDLIGDAVANATNREFFTDDVAETLGERFDERYGHYIVEALEKFAPYECHSQAVLDLRTELERLQDRKLIPILFEGQGIGRVFDRHRENLEAKLDEGVFAGQAPAVRAILRRLDGTKERIEAALDQFREGRAGYYLDDLRDKHEARTDGGVWHPFLVSQLNDLYGNVYTTVAFQSALVCGFFGEMEHARRLRRHANGSPNESDGIDKAAAFEHYLDALDRFFVPQRFAEMRRLLRVFYGKLERAGGEWKLRPSNQTFNGVVQHGAMKPDKWPTYKYLLLEIWEPEDADLAEAARRTKSKSRKQVFRRLHRRARKAYCRDEMKLEENLTAQERRSIFEGAHDAYTGFLENVEADNVPSESDFKKMLVEDFADLEDQDVD